MISTTRRSGRGGFTLIEVAVATAIIGIGVVALLVAIASNTRVNDAGSKLSQAIVLAQELREWTMALPFSDQDPGDKGNPPGPDGSDPQVFVDDLDDMMGVTYSPPRDGEGQALHSLQGWAQTIELTWCDPNDLNAVVTPGESNVIYAQVHVAFKGRPILTTGWLVTRREDE